MGFGKLAILRCYSKEKLFPPGNPLFCNPESSQGENQVSECCHQEDFCNLYLNPKLRLLQRGEQVFRGCSLNVAAQFPCVVELSLNPTISTPGSGLGRF